MALVLRGQRRRAHDIEIPPQAEESSLAGQLADLCHEWAAPGRSEVRRLGERPGGASQ